MTNASVDSQSAERAAMQADIDLISDVLAGVDAMRARSKVYLPQYGRELEKEYRRRVSSAPWRPEFVDVLRTLSAKPFSQPITLPADTPKAIVEFADNVDGRGNNLHVFAHRLFVDAVAYGISIITIDFPKRTWGPSVADAIAANPRPYWCLIPISNVIALYTEFKNGREIVVHLRTREDTTVVDGFGEKLVERIRVIDRGSWSLWEKRKDASGTTTWVSIDGGELQNGSGKLDAVPAVIVVTGDRQGTIKTKPPLKDLADMQVELFRALSRQDELLTFAGSPMLATTQYLDQTDGTTKVVEVGPKTVLGGASDNKGDQTKWYYVQPDAANIREVREHVESVIEDMQRLGLQPTITRSGTASATESDITAAKAHSALQAWALTLKDALEQAFVLTMPWMSENGRVIDPFSVSVNVHTDFAASFEATTEASTILTAEKQRVISKQTARDELARRGILGPAFQSRSEPKKISSEGAAT